MPVRNVIKEYAPESYYHIYNRGVNKADIFLDQRDFATFLSFLKRYLGDELTRRTNHSQHPNYQNEIELLAFCLMSNHFHLFIYQTEAEAMTRFMKSLTIAYSMYFNKRYKRVGPVFQQRYKAVRIQDDAQLLHITRYIHLNPGDYQKYEWSSLPYYLGTRKAPWVKAKRVQLLFEDDNYLNFLQEYSERRDELKLLKRELAG